MRYCLTPVLLLLHPVFSQINVIAPDTQIQKWESGKLSDQSIAICELSVIGNILAKDLKNAGHAIIMGKSTKDVVIARKAYGN